MTVARVERGLIVSRRVDCGYLVRDQILLCATEIMILIDFEVKTCDELDIVLLSKDTAVLGVVASIEVVILPCALVDAGLSVVTPFT